MVGNSLGICNPKGVEDLTFFSLLEVEVAEQEKSEFPKTNSIHPNQCTCCIFIDMEHKTNEY